MNYELHQLDAMAFLRSLEAGSVDVLVSSPPYFMGKEYDVSEDVEDFASIHAELLPLLLRALKPGGSLCWQIGNHVNDGELVPLDALVFAAFSGSELKLRNRIVWTFGHGTHAKRRLSGRHETVLWYTKGSGDYYFDLDAVRVPQKYPGKRHYKGPNKGELSGNPLGKNPGDVWEIPNVNARHIEKTDHPCQYPVALVQRLVRALAPPDGVVADPFMGAGSAGVAAIVEGRRFIGNDIEPRYVEIARDRLRRAAVGEVNYRSIDTPVYVPDPRESVATLPDAFAEARKKVGRAPNLEIPN